MKWVGIAIAIVIFLAIAIIVSRAERNLFGPPAEERAKRKARIQQDPRASYIVKQLGKIYAKFFRLSGGFCNQFTYDFRELYYASKGLEAEFQNLPPEAIRFEEYVQNLVEEIEELYRLHVHY